MKLFIQRIFILLAFFAIYPTILLSQQDLLKFIENRGQWEKEVKYLLKTKSFNAWITDSALIYDYYSLDFNKDNKSIDKVKGNVISMHILGTNSKSKFTPTDKQTTTFNYFIGNDQNKWKSNVSIYQEVLVENIYDKINLRYYLDKDFPEHLRYDFEVKENADLTQIEFNIKGADSVAINENNELIIITQENTFSHKNIYAYQNIDNINKQVPCYFLRKENGAIGFKVDDYDKSYPLIIDPLIYSVLIGSINADYAYSIAVDTLDAAYITGETYSPRFPITSGAYESYFNQNYSQHGSIDCFVAKISPDGKQLLHSTFIGGSKRERANHIALDSEQNIVIVGETESADTISPHTGFPLKSSNPNFAKYNGGWDVFIAKFNNSCSELIFSILLGSDLYDISGALAIDSLDRIYVAGQTQASSSKQFPTTTGAYSQTHQGGNNDAFISVINQSGNELLYSTLFGGTKEEAPTAILIDSYKNICIVGNTTSSNLPITPNSYQQLHRGKTDIFCTKFDSTLTNILYSTFIGGSDDDIVKDASIDNLNQIYCTGYAISNNFPTTNGAYCTQSSDSTDIIVFKLNSTFSDLLFSTTITSNSHSYATGIALDSNKNIHISGYTKSNDFPTTADAFFIDYSKYGDIVYVVFDSSGTNLNYSSYIGGKNYDYSYGIALDKAGSAYLVGTTTSNQDFPHSRIFTDTLVINNQIRTLDSYDAVVFKATDKPYPGEMETNINSFGNEFCPGTSQLIRIFTPHSFYLPGNIFSVQLSDSAGTFNSPTIIGTVEATATTDVSIQFPKNLPKSEKYRIRVVSSRPRSISNDNGQDIKIRDSFLHLESIDTTKGFCTEENVQLVVLKNNCFEKNNKFQVELSDENGNFSQPTIIAEKDIDKNIDTIIIEVPQITKSGDYKIRISSTNPKITSEARSIKLFKPEINIVTDQNLVFCANEVFELNFSANHCFKSDNNFYLILSNENGNFDNPDEIDTIGVASNEALEDSIPSIICKIPEDIISSENYKIKLLATSPLTEIISTTKIELGTPKVFVTKLINKQFCKGFNFDIEIEANDCFEQNNKFTFFLKIGEEWQKIGESIENNNAKISIPDIQEIEQGKYLMKISSSAPATETEDFTIEIATPYIQIEEISPNIICAGRIVQLKYSSNKCFLGNDIFHIELSDEKGEFKNPVKKIGNFTFSTTDTVVSVTIPDNLSASDYKIRLRSEKLTSKEFSIKIEKAKVDLDFEISDTKVFCTGTEIQLDYTANGCFNFDNVFTFEISDEKGEFNLSKPIIVGEVISSKSGSLIIIIPNTLAPSDKYKLKVTSSSPKNTFIFDNYLSLETPRIEIDSLKNLQICINTEKKGGKSVLNSDIPIKIPFFASDCFDSTTKFILQLAANNDFTQAINIDTCNWNERFFECFFPSDLEDLPYRMRVISTNPKVASKDNGVDIKFAKPDIQFANFVPISVCKNASTKFEYLSTICFNEDNTFYLEISDNTGNFSLSRIIAHSSALGEGVFTAVLPEDVPAGNSYKLRIRSTSPAKIFDNENLLFIVSEPEILTGNLHRTALSRNDTIYVPFNTNCLEKNETAFIVQLSDPFGNFRYPLEIGKRTGWETEGTILAKISQKANNGSKYRVRVISTDPKLIIGNDNQKNISIYGDVALEEELNKLEIFPNPFTDKITVKINSNELFNYDAFNIELQDYLGNTIERLEAIDNLSCTISTKHLTAGVYFLTVSSRDFIKKYKLLRIN